jgi:predicted permease
VESVREQRSLPWIESIAGDVRFAIRHFRRTPLSTVTMVLVLSLGIGANIVLFTLLNSLATLPAPGIERDASLVRVRGTMSSKTMSDEPRLMSWPEVQEYSRRTDVFSSVAAHADESAVVNLGDGSATPTTVSLVYATPNYFRTLNVRPVLGTEPIAESGGLQMTTSPTAVISYAMWQQSFGGARDILGRTVRINDIAVQIVGVAPPRFLGTSGGSRLTMWAPLAAYPMLQKRSPATFSSYDSTFLTVSAQLRPGMTPKAATPIVAGMAARISQLAKAARAVSAAASQDLVAGADVVPMLAGNSRASARRDMLISGVASSGFALLILLITCTNVSALMVGLAVARRKEIGVRLSLGAPRKRLIRQLLTESVLLSLVAAALGLFVTIAGIRIIGASLVDVQLVVDWHVTLATCAVAIFTGIVFGLSPALHATRVSVADVLRGSASSVAATRSRLQRGLVVAQIALTQPLLVGLGVVVVTMMTDVRTRASSTAAPSIAEVELDTWSGRVSNEERAARIDALLSRVTAMPGVIAAVPLQLGTVTAPLSVHPSDRVAGISYPSAMQTNLVAAPRGYFNVFNIPVRRGRDFDASEYAHTSNDPGAAPSFTRVIIGSDLASKLFGSANPVGRRLSMAGSDTAAMVVVGVVDAEAAGPSIVNDQYRVFVPYSMINEGVIVRTAGPALPFLNALRRVAMETAPQMPVKRVQTMEQREAAARRDVVKTSSAVAAGGLLALLLSAIGLYAVVSFGVGQRVREIGIRTALGAQPRQVVGMFFGKGLLLSGLGLALGLPLSIVATRMVSSSVGLSVSSSPLVGAGIGVVVLMVASVAVWIPARRASGIDPNVALRGE